MTIIFLVWLGTAIVCGAELFLRFGWRAGLLGVVMVLCALAGTLTALAMKVR